MKKTHIFFNLNTYSRISLCAGAHFLRYVEGKHQGHRIAFLDVSNVVFDRKNNDLSEFKVHLIHWKYISLLHNKDLFS